MEFAEFLKETEDSDETAWDMDFTGLNQTEINIKLLQIVNSYKIKKLMPKEKFLEYFKESAWFTASILNFSKFQDILATDELKDMFRNFMFRQMLVINQFYYQIEHLPLHDKSQLGVGLVFFAKFNHSCTPNVHTFYDDSKIHFTVLRPIRKGEQLFLGYENFAYLPVEARQEALFKRYNFICKCEACEDPTKYPLKCNLLVKNPLTINKYFITPLAHNLIFDLEAAVKNYRPICKYLEENDHHYPALEISMLECLIGKCYQLFCMVDEFP
jgi:hypothetical protein